MDRIKSLCETLIRILGNHTMLIVCVVGLLAAVCLAYVVGNGIYKQFNPPVEVTTMPQEQAEEPHGVQQAAEAAQVTVDYGQQKEVAKEIQIIREKEEVPVYIVQSTGKTVEKDVKQAVKENKADFAIVTYKNDPEKEINLKEIPKEEKIELNQYNIQAYKNQINTLSYAPQGKVVGYEHSWKVSKSGQYIGVGIDHDIDDQKTYVKITYSW